MKFSFSGGSKYFGNYAKCGFNTKKQVICFQNFCFNTQVISVLAKRAVLTDFIHHKPSNQLAFSNSDSSIEAIQSPSLQHIYASLLNLSAGSMGMTIFKITSLSGIKCLRCVTQVLSNTKLQTIK